MCNLPINCFDLIPVWLSNFCTLFVPLRSRYKRGTKCLSILHLNALKDSYRHLMSSNIKILRVCQHCGKDFTARTTTTLYCSHKCNSTAYKAKQRTSKVEASNTETIKAITRPIEQLKAKDFLTVREVANLLNCSVRTIYYNIESGNLKAVNLGERITRVKRSDLDKLFDINN